MGKGKVEWTDYGCVFDCTYLPLATTHLLFLYTVSRIKGITIGCAQGVPQTHPFWRAQTATGSPLGPPSNSTSNVDWLSLLLISEASILSILRTAPFCMTTSEPIIRTTFCGLCKGSF